MKKGFVFYKSFWEIFEMLSDPADWRTLLRAICKYCFEGVEPSFDSLSLSIAFKHFQTACDASSDRYDKAVENGKSGGKQSKRDFIPPDVWISKILELESIPKAAKELGLAKQTLYNWVSASDDPRLKNSPIVQSNSPTVQKSKKHNNKEIEFDNDNENKSLSNLKNKNANPVAADAYAPPRDGEKERNVQSVDEREVPSIEERRAAWTKILADMEQDKKERILSEHDSRRDHSS